MPRPFLKTCAHRVKAASTGSISWVSSLNAIALLDDESELQPDRMISAGIIWKRANPRVLPDPKLRLQYARLMPDTQHSEAIGASIWG